MVGTRLEVAVPILLSTLGLTPQDEVVQEWMAWLLVRMVSSLAGPLPLKPGALELLTELTGAGVPLALVYSSYRVLVDAVLDHGVGPFAVTVAGDEVERGKPDPEPYRTEARRLGVDPARCVVLEDSPVGVVSGTAAGYAVIAVPNLYGLVIGAAARRRVTTSLADVDRHAPCALVG